MLKPFTPPSWAEVVIVAGDAAYSSKANITLVQQLDNTDQARDWYFVFAISRTGKTVDDTALKDLVHHLPRCYYQRIWVLASRHGNYRQTSWVYAKSRCLRDIGDVTLVLSKMGHNVSPAKTKLLVTNLPMHCQTSGVAVPK